MLVGIQCCRRRPPPLPPFPPPPCIVNPLYYDGNFHGGILPSFGKCHRRDKHLGGFAAELSPRLISSQREGAERAETTRGPRFVSRGKTLRAKPSVDQTTKAIGNCKRLRRKLRLVLFSWESCKYIYFGTSNPMCLYLLPLRCPAVELQGNNRQKFVTFSTSEYVVLLIVHHVI